MNLSGNGDNGPRKVLDSGGTCSSKDQRPRGFDHKVTYIIFFFPVTMYYYCLYTLYYRSMSNCGEMTCF